MSSGELRCQSSGCEGVVTHAWFWPGTVAPEDPIRVSCFPCALKVAVILDALGTRIQCLDLDSVRAMRDKKDAAALVTELTGFEVRDNPEAPGLPRIFT